MAMRLLLSGRPGQAQQAVLQRLSPCCAPLSAPQHGYPTHESRSASAGLRQITRCQVLQAERPSPPQTSTSEAPPAAPPFHLAFPVRDIDEARAFYGGQLSCQEGRSAASWVDFSLFGHQIVCHQVKGYNAASSHNDVDGDPVPVPHFGLALSVPQFHSFAEQLKAAGIEFIIKPHLRFEGQPGEQYTMFFKDPSGNALEFKAMTRPENLFAKYYVT